MTACTTACMTAVTAYLVVHGSPVVLQSGLVAEGGGADVAVEHVARVRGQHVSRQADRGEN